MENNCAIVQISYHIFDMEYALLLMVNGETTRLNISANKATELITNHRLSDKKCVDVVPDKEFIYYMFNTK